MKYWLYITVVIGVIMILPSAVNAQPSIDSDVIIETVSEDEEDEREDKLDLEFVEITDGLEQDEKTFDEKRSVSGEAKEGTTVTFVVYQGEKNEKAMEETQQVGASGLFNQLIQLKHGKNQIDFIAEYQDEKIKRSFIIERKNDQIKKELEVLKVEFIKDE
jgi:hypothetical protein